MSLATFKPSPAPPGIAADLRSRVDPLYEFVNGEPLETPGMSAYAAKVASRLLTRLNEFAQPRGLGEAVVEALFRLPLDEDRERNRRPDVACVSSERWPANRPQPVEDRAWDVVPDLAVEVVSPSDLAEEQLGKIVEYFRAGVRLVWIVYPKQRRAHVFKSATRVRVVTEDEALDGGSVLAEFRLPLASLFDPPLSH